MSILTVEWYYVPTYHKMSLCLYLSFNVIMSPLTIEIQYHDDQEQKTGGVDWK